MLLGEAYELPKVAVPSVEPPALVSAIPLELLGEEVLCRTEEASTVTFSSVANPRFFFIPISMISLGSVTMEQL